MGNCYNYTPIPPAEASCIIAHLFVELALPCSCCKREDGVIVIQGKTYDGSSARVTIKGEEVRYYGKQRTLAAIRELDGPHLTRQHLPPAAEHGRLFLQLFPGAQTITERRHNSWPKN